MTGVVRSLRSAPVKGFPQHDRAELALDTGGIRDDRRFVIVDDTGRVLYGADLPAFVGARSSWDGAVLALTFADGGRAEAAVEPGERIDARASGGRQVPGVLVPGPFAAALSDRAGRDLRLVHVAVGTGAPGPVTIIGDGTLRRLQRELGVAELDARRFRMSIELEGLDAHEEDSWSGRAVQIGQAVLAVGGPVPRCVLTTRHPDTGVRDLDTLRAILAYRPAMATGEPPLGVYATVLEPAVIRVGDTVRLLDAERARQYAR